MLALSIACLHQIFKTDCSVGSSAALSCLCPREITKRIYQRTGERHIRDSDSKRAYFISEKQGREHLSRKWKGLPTAAGGRGEYNTVGRTFRRRQHGTSRECREPDSWDWIQILDGDPGSHRAKQRRQRVSRSTFRSHDPHGSEPVKLIETEEILVAVIFVPLVQVSEKKVVMCFGCVCWSVSSVPQ